MEVIILGAGIVGLTMASLLAQNANLQISLVDPSPQSVPYDNSDYDIRCSAITHASQQIFTKIGVWDSIIAERVAAYKDMIIWDQTPEIKVHFSAADLGVANLGYIIENRVISKVLYNNLLNTSNVTIIEGAATALDTQTDFIKLTVGTQVITGQLVIGADGAHSWLRSNSNIPVHHAEYGHAALVACVESSLSHNHTARQRFMPDGPLAFLPLSEPNYSSIVWSSKPEVIEELMSLEENVFCARLSESFSNVLGSLRLHGKRVSFPLRMIHATQYVLPRLALIGDAAHVLHPLAGQGLNLGLLDAQSLVECVFEAIAEKRDIGGFAVLRKYERSRKSHNLSMISLVGTVKRLFAFENRLLKNIRNHGMHYLDEFNTAKNFMMRFALGI